MNKSSLIIFDKIICRTPAFPLKCIFDKEWGFLKQLIKDSSPEFYRIIKGLDASEIESQPFKVRYTIWKYWNRARYRATPFGRFAALTLLPVNSSRDDDPIHLSSKMNYKEFVSWKNISHLDLSAKSIRQDAAYFLINSSFYVVGNEIRYIYNDNGTFQLTSVELQDSLLRVLQYCGTKRTTDDVNHFISELLQLSESEIDELLEQLIDMQLLFTDRQPNIIGRDYFQRIGHTVNEGISTHTISERTLISGGIPRSKLEHLKELIPLLSRILPVTHDPDLMKFKSSFRVHYEHRLEVPLLEALDPEVGIGYLTLDNRPSELQLVNDILSSKEEVEVFPEVVYSELHRFLLQNFNGKEPIRLEQMKFGEKDGHEIRLPNTFSAVLQLTEDFAVLKQAGGASATAMTGRLTLLSESFESLGREIASFEEETNSNVLFFDIAYSADNQVDDVNRRKRLYKFALPIVMWNEGQDGLELNDIMVSVANDQIVLRSKRYNRRVVPRLATAYNYKRSELSVFRFLSDLQHQGFQTNLTMNIEVLLPYLNYYPRVMYKDIVVSPSKWLIPEQFYGGGRSESEKLQELRKWLTKCRIDQPFLCGRSDQKLCFDPRQEEELLYFLQFLKGKGRLYIEEFFLHNDSVVNDETNRPYLSEFVVNFGHTVRVYNTNLSSRGMDNRSESNSQRMQFMQGSEWLYVKIYCHPNRSNELLLNVIQKMAEEHKAKIEKWFFIRYLDPDYHIRLRIKLEDRNDFSILLEGIQKEFQPYLSAGTVRDIQLAIYNREIERYPIDYIENIFSLDSSFSLRVMQEDLSPEHVYAMSVDLLIETMNGVKMSLNDQRNFLKEMTKHFSNEHKLTTAVYKKINTQFRSFKEAYSDSFHIGSLKEDLLDLSSQYSYTLSRCRVDDRQKLLADFFHMHVNRLYIENQRVHEMVLYEFAFKVMNFKSF